MNAAFALSRWAQRSPEAPWIFFRGSRGHFEWISFGDAEAYLSGTPGRSRAPRILPADVEAWIRWAAALPFDREPGAGASLRAKSREVWVAWRAVSAPAQTDLARWAIGRGAAILVETQASFPVELVEWARPTLIDAPYDALHRWFDALESGAPNWLRRRRARRRIGRARWLLVAEDSPSSLERGELEAATQALERRWLTLLPESAGRVVRFDPADEFPLV